MLANAYASSNNQYAAQARWKSNKFLLDWEKTAHLGVLSTMNGALYDRSVPLLNHLKNKHGVEVTAATLMEGLSEEEKTRFWAPSSAEVLHTLQKQNGLTRRGRAWDT